MIRFWAERILAAVALFLAAPAAACSVWEGYRIPSNFELVHRADLIVLARVVSDQAATAPDRAPQVSLAPVRVLKGMRSIDRWRWWAASAGTALP